MTTDPPDKNLPPIRRLIEVMARLRDPNCGCPWDLEQSFATIAPYTIEEAYEVAEAIASGDRDALKDELGDLLFQVVYYAQMSREDGGFDFDAIAVHEVDKMTRRHPHVFGNVDVADAAAQTRNWEAQKAAERAAKGEAGKPPASVLDGIARALPALIRAEKLTKRAARVGFDWPTVAEVIAKIEEELAETAHEVAQDGSRERLEDEIGDLLFAVANLARKLEIDPEAALRGTNDKFIRRFNYIEAELRARGKSPMESNLDEMDALWNAAKNAEKETP
ncbi:MAG: nucleoside triphosphate pyrophosphohydrolase [Alphaproteobacteria bacterium]